MAYFHFIHVFGNGRLSYASEPIAKSVERNCSKKRRRPMQREFEVTYFSNNMKWRYLYCSCICKACQLLNDNSFYSLITHQLNIKQSPSLQIEFIIIIIIIIIIIMWVRFKMN